LSVWLVPREGLTLEQLRAVELNVRENHIILGGPGSGKTMVLLHRADYLRRKYNVLPERYHIFVYTKTLKEYIRSALWALDLPDDCISTLHGWSVQYYRSHIDSKLPRNEKTRLPDFGVIFKAIYDYVYMSRKPIFDFVVVDEGQDLSKDAFHLLHVLSHHVTVCMDHKQQIYDTGSTEEQAASALNIRGSDLIFLDTFRCSRYIVELSARFIPDPVERANFLRQTRTEEINIETPVLYYAEDFEDERARLIEIVESRMKFDERIGIIFPRKDQVFGFNQALAAAGLEVEVQDKKIDFTSDRPKLMTYHSAKGLTFDTVIMPRLVPKSFMGVPPGHLERQLFTGITRARKWVYMSTDQKWPLPQLKRLEELADRGLLTIRRPKGTEQPSLFSILSDNGHEHIKVNKDNDHDLPDIL
jgi:superfamily I DNA/RNA helicase